MTFTEAIICVKFGLELFKKTEVSYIVMWLSIQVHDISVADRQTRQSHVLAKICFTGIENNGDHSKALLNVPLVSYKHPNSIYMHYKFS